MAKSIFRQHQSLSMDSSTTKSKLATTAAISLKPSKTRRGYGRKKAKFNVKSQTLTVVGTNAGGLKLKRESLFFFSKYRKLSPLGTLPRIREKFEDNLNPEYISYSFLYLSAGNY